MASVLLANSGAWLVALLFGVALLLLLFGLILYCQHRERRSHASMQPSESAQQATEETVKEFIKEGFLYVEGLQGEIETSCLVQTEAERIWIRCDGNKSQPILLDKSNTRVINGDGCEFLLSCGEAKYVLRAESVKTKLEWLNALQKHYLLADTESVSSQESVFLPPPFPRRHFSHRMSSETRTEALEISFPATSKTSTIKLVSVMRSFNIDGMITNHHLAGIGIKFTYLPSRKLYQIVDIDVLSSAAGKLKIGDVLFAVDGKPIKEKLPHEITALIVGLRGSAVTLGVSRLQSSARDAKEQEMMSKARRLYDRGVELCHARLYDEAIIQLQQAEDLWANDCDDLLAASAAYRARVSAMRRRLTQDEVKEAYEDCRSKGVPTFISRLRAEEESLSLLSRKSSFDLFDHSSSRVMRAPEDSISSLPRAGSFAQHHPGHVDHRHEQSELSARLGMPWDYPIREPASEVSSPNETPILRATFVRGTHRPSPHIDTAQRSPSLPPLKPVTVLSQTPTGVKVTTRGFSSSSPHVQHHESKGSYEQEIERTQSDDWRATNDKPTYGMKAAAAEGVFYGSQSLSLADTLDQKGMGELRYQASLSRQPPLEDQQHAPFTDAPDRPYSNPTKFQGPKLSILSIKTLSGNRELREQIYSKLHEKSQGEIHNAESLSEQVDEYLREQSGHNRSEEIGRSLNHHVRSPQNVQHTTKARERHRDITKLEQEENEEDEEGEEEDEMAFMIREIDKQGYNRSSVSWKKLDEAALRGRNEMFARGFVRAMKSRYDQQVGGEEEVSACAWCGKGFKSLRQRRIHDLKCKGKSAAKIVNPPQKSGSSKKLLPNVDETLFRKQKKMSEVGLC